ncbi:MAG: FAD-dependent oxidoreductase [Chloroflexi bacterium]|nr:MAG: FAD-dependent oxidoreductase [Chloroflexota bacterium]
MPRRVAIVGAGVAGLVAGRELARRGHAVTLYERWPDVSGQASAFDLGGGVWIDRYYHHLFQSDSDMIALHDELTPGELEWHTSSVGIWARGRVWPFVSPMDLLRYRPLPLVDRLRLGYSVLRLTARTDWERMDDIGALEWLRRASGERALASVWTPLMLGKFGADSERVPLAWLWSKFRLRRKLRGSGATKEQERSAWIARCCASQKTMGSCCTAPGRAHIGDAPAKVRRSPRSTVAPTLCSSPHRRSSHAVSPTGPTTGRVDSTTGPTRPRSCCSSSCVVRSAPRTGRTSRTARSRSSVWSSTPTSCRPSATRRVICTLPTTSRAAIHSRA